VAVIYSNGASNYIGAADIAATTAWYIEKLDLRKVDVDLDDPENCVALGFAKDDYALCIGPGDGSGSELSPRLNCSNAKKAKDFLSSRGVIVGDVQQDGQGTHYFEMRDLEGNSIEICEEP